MTEKKRGVSKRRGAGKVLLATTLASTAATSAMTQSTTASADFMDLLKSTKEKVTSALKKVKDKLPTTNTLIKTVISAAGAISLKGYIEELVTSSKKESMNSVINNALFEYALHGDAERAMAPVVSSRLLRIPGFSKFLTFFLVSIVGYSIYQFAPVLLEKVKKGGKYLWNKKKENLEIKKLCNEIEKELNLNIYIFSNSRKGFLLFSKFDGKTRISKQHYYDQVDNEKIKKSKNIRFKVEETSGEFSIKIVNENGDTLAESLSENILLESPKYRKYMNEHYDSDLIKSKIENYNKDIEYCKRLYDELNDKLEIIVDKVTEEKMRSIKIKSINICIKDKESKKVISKSTYECNDNFVPEELEFGLARSIEDKKVHIDIRPKNNVENILKLNGVEEKLKEYIENKDNTLQ